MVCKVFQIKNNKICYKKFTKKGNYCLPAIIEGIASSHEYLVKFIIDDKMLKIEKKLKYICDYHLIKACSDEVFKLILNDLNKE